MSGPAQVAERLAFGYTRVSLAEQAQGVSLEVQRARIGAYAAAKGLNLAAVFVDAGISGKELDRPGLQQLLAQCAAGQAGHVIVWRLDRLTRRTRHLLGLVEDLFLARGIEMHSVSESLDTSTPHGRFVLTLFGGLAQMERETIAERTRAALAWKRAAGQPTSHAPLGFRSVGKRAQMEPVMEELDIVRRILALRQAGRSYRGIARALNAEGVWTKRRALWRHSTVAKIVGARDRYVAVLDPQTEAGAWKTPATPERACPRRTAATSARMNPAEAPLGTPSNTPQHAEGPLRHLTDCATMSSGANPPPSAEAYATPSPHVEP